MARRGKPKLHLLTGVQGLFKVGPFRLHVDRLNCKAVQCRKKIRGRLDSNAHRTARALTLTDQDYRRHSPPLGSQPGATPVGASTHSKARWGCWQRAAVWTVGWQHPQQSTLGLLAARSCAGCGLAAQDRTLGLLAACNWGAVSC
jgi:hypothetical protein